MAVTFTSHGYDTTTANPYTEVAWAEAHPVIGAAQYGVRGVADWKVTVVTSADRTISVAPGFGWGCGVTDETFQNETIPLGTIGSGSRWDLIVARRDWTPTAGETKFMAIPGGSTRAIPGGRLSNPGGIDDQPIALVQVTAGQTQPTAIVDLRCWAGNGGVVAKDILARDYLNMVGAVVYVGGVQWRYSLGANDVPEWIPSGPINAGAATDLTGLRGSWTAPFAGNRRPRVWSTDGITAHSTGLVQYGGSNKDILTIPAPFAPTDSSSITYVGSVVASNGPTSINDGASLQLGINGGVLQIIYQSGDMPVGSYVPVVGSWRINN